MIYKYTKCESVIAKILSDLNMSESDMRITDMREWIFEAVEKIGAPMQYIEKESCIDDCPMLVIHDYQTPLPDDLVHLTAVAYSPTKKGRFVTMRTNNSQFRQQKHVHDHHHHHHCDHDHEYPLMHRPITTQSQFYGVNGMRYLDRALADGASEDPQFFIKPGWIVTNRKHGFIKIQYKAIATDERGYPLIPDLPSYQEAIYWYVTMKLQFPKFLTGQLGSTKSRGAAQSNQNIYFYIQQQWNFYRNQAYAEAMMPTESDMISIKNEWTKLIPDWDSDETFFRPEGEKQLNYTDYYYGY